jgi:hypothetical protein
MEDPHCCDFRPCDNSVDGACKGSANFNGGASCVYSTSEDTYGFTCPVNWFHSTDGDASCAINDPANLEGDYTGAFMDSMCCCAPVEGSCSSPPDGKAEYLYGTQGDLEYTAPWYASINISKKGSLNGEYSDAFNIFYESFGGNSDKFSSFIKLVRVCNDGVVQCGRVNGNSVSYDSAFCNGGSSRIDYFSVAECAKTGVESDPKRYTYLMRISRIYEDGSHPPGFFNMIAVPGFYQILGLNDKEFYEKRRQIIDAYHACSSQDNVCGQKVSPDYYDYCTEFILARDCDMPKPVNVTLMCKNVPLEPKKFDKPYDEKVIESNFTVCVWDMIDGGRYDEHPYIYVAYMNKSKHAVLLGLRNYDVNSMQREDSTHIVNPTSDPAIKESNVNSVLDWNKKSAGRILGCRTDSYAFWSDRCDALDSRCTQGAALAMSYNKSFPPDSFRSNISKKCGYFEYDQPRTSMDPGATADYFQFNDLDDEDRDIKSDPFNEVEYFDDRKFDFEMGIPDRNSLVNQSIESILTTIDAAFIPDGLVRWKGTRYRFDFNLGSCSDGSKPLMKYYQIPWGNKTKNDDNGPWYGGVTYEYSNPSHMFLRYSDYPKASEWESWEDQDANCSNPIVFKDGARLEKYPTPAGVDRYWLIAPSEARQLEPNLLCTRPAHGGEITPLYYSNPSGYLQPGDKVRVSPFNYNLRYYRQFNRRMVWTNVFKITPEFHNRPPEDDKCNPETDNTVDDYGDIITLGNGKGDCDDYSDCNQGSHCSQNTDFWETDFCCTYSYEWDQTRSCCMRCGVPSAKLGDYDYCEKKISDNNYGFDCRCDRGEGGCFTVANACKDPLVCKPNIYFFTRQGNNRYSACCYQNEYFDGRTCIGPNSEVSQPGTVIYTRTGGDSAEVYEIGGGPIWFHFAGGGNLPNANESGGNYSAVEYCKKVICNDDVGCSQAKCGSWDLSWGSSPFFDNSASWDTSNFWNNDICAKSWTYMRDQGGIWDEQMNLGNTLIPIEGDGGVHEQLAEDYGEGYWDDCPLHATYCYFNFPFSGGYWCDDPLGCNCHTNYKTLAGPGPWTFANSGDGTQNSNIPCDSFLANDGTNPSPPDTCGKLCRKMVQKDFYQSVPVEAWFNYTIFENKTSQPGWVATKSGGMDAGANVFPLETPWNFLHVGDSVLQHSLDDGTNKFKIELNYTATHSLVRMPLTQSCIWNGCEASQIAVWQTAYYVYNYDDGSTRTQYSWDDCPNSPCGPCTYYPSYPTTSLNNQSGVVNGTVTAHALGQACLRCWGAWSHQPCNYPVSKENSSTPIGQKYYGSDNKNHAALEEINDTSTVKARPYGNHLETSRPLGNGGSHATINVNGFLDYKWEGGAVDFRDFRINGLLKIKGLGMYEPNSPTDRKDMIGGFELFIPNYGSIRFTAKDYPVIHELFVLDSTLIRQRIPISDTARKMLHLPVCNPPEDSKPPCRGTSSNLCLSVPSGRFCSDYYDPVSCKQCDIGLGPNCKISENSFDECECIHDTYYYYVQNPSKKYYYYLQGTVTDETQRAFYAGIGEIYSWDTVVYCDGEDDNLFLDDPSITSLGILRSYHEDEPNYWDLAGFYVQKNDIEANEPNEFSLNTGSGSDAMSFKKTPEGEGNIQYEVNFNPPTNEYYFNFSTISIKSDDMANARLRIYSDFRAVEITPFKDGDGALSCDNDRAQNDVGSVHSDVYMRHPVRLEITGSGSTVTVSGVDMCGGTVSGPVKIKFDFPYTDYSSDATHQYQIGQSIELPKRSHVISLTAEYPGQE